MLKIAEGAVPLSISPVFITKVGEQSRIQCQRVEDNAFHLY